MNQVEEIKGIDEEMSPKSGKSKHKTKQTKPPRKSGVKRHIPKIRSPRKLVKASKKKLTYYKGQPVFLSGGKRYIYRTGWGMVEITQRKQKKRKK